MLSHASMIAGKTMGFKPTVGAVKSVQLANAAAKKVSEEVDTWPRQAADGQEQMTAERKAQIRAEGEARRAEAARKKEEAEKLRIEEERKARAAELEEKRRMRAEAEKRRKEREEKIAIAAREKAAKEEAEKAAAKAKVCYSQSSSHCDTNQRPRKRARSASLPRLLSTSLLQRPRRWCPTAPTSPRTDSRRQATPSLCALSSPSTHLLDRHPLSPCHHPSSAQRASGQPRRSQPA